MITKVLTAAAVAAAMIAASPVKKPAKDGWQMLFDGKSFKGWHTYGKTTMSDDWKIADGAVYVDEAHKKDPGKNHGGDLVTDQSFGDFDLKYEWKISEGGNSGLMFYVHEDTARYKQTYNTGPEMQVIDNDRHADAKIVKHRAGDLYDLIACSKEMVKPVGEWNQAEIISRNGRLQLFLNGTKVVETMLWNDSWNALVAGSKFKTMPGFGTYKSGRIALQDHGDAVWFRNIMIKKL